MELTSAQKRLGHLTNCQLIVGNAPIKGHQGEAYGKLMAWLEEELAAVQKLVDAEHAAEAQLQIDLSTPQPITGDINHGQAS